MSNTPPATVVFDTETDEDEVRLEPSSVAKMVKASKTKPDIEPKSIFDDLSGIAEEYAEVDELELAIPGTRRRLYATYRPLLLNEMTQIWGMIERQKFPDQRQEAIYMSIDILLKANTGIKFKDADGNMKEAPQGMRLGKALAVAIFGPPTTPYLDGHMGDRQAMLQIFKNNDSQILDHSGMVQQWFKDTTAKIGNADFLGDF